jgi:hypothetical protein
MIKIFISAICLVILCAFVEYRCEGWGIALALVLTWPHALFWVLRGDL